MRRSWGWLILTVPVFAACAQVIGADFDGLLPDNGTGGSAGVNQAGGASGSAGDGAPAGGGGMGLSGGGGAGVVAGSAAGSVIKDASTDKTGSGGATVMSDASTDVVFFDTAFADRGDTGIVVASDAPIEGSVVINEIKGVGGGPDWIELYNPGQSPMVLDGYIVSQAMGSTGPPDLPGSLTFPQGTVLAGGALLMVVAQQTAIGGTTSSCQAIADSCFTVTWGISSAGERIYLLKPEGDGGGAILQQVDYPASVTSGQTYARTANGTYQAAAPTTDQPNGI